MCIRDSSHTSTHGAMGAIAFGIGTSEVEMVLTEEYMSVRPYLAMKSVKLSVKRFPLYAIPAASESPAPEMCIRDRLYKQRDGVIIYLDKTFFNIASI